MMINNPRELGALIKEARIKVGMSQTDLAIALGTYQPEISKLENGHPGARISLVFQMAKVLGLRVFIDSENAMKLGAHVISSREELDELDDIANTGLKK